jgi:hypothetical protein
MRNTNLLSVVVTTAAACSISPDSHTAVGVSSTAGEQVATTSSPTTVAVVPTPRPAATLAPYVPFTAQTWADNVLLRTNPGYLFPQVTTLPQGTALRVIARSQGGEWLFVQLPDQRSGWVFLQLVETADQALDRVPVIAPSDALLVRGRVATLDGMPVSGIQFAIVQGDDTDAPRNAAVTDDSGTFYAFMPSGSTGRWWLGYTAISCESNIMDANCNWSGGPHPQGLYIELPSGAGAPYSFDWR